MGFKKLIKSIIMRSEYLSRFYLHSLLKLHNMSYNLIGPAAIQFNNGIHPKRRIINYEKWFFDKVNEGDKVIDIGCNRGYLCSYISHKCSEVIGIDLDKSHIEYAKKNYPLNNLEFIHADATEVDLADLAPQKLILSNVLEHIEFRVDFLKRLKELTKKVDELKILIRVPLIERDWLAVFKKDFGIDYRLDPTHFTEYTQSEFHEELSLAGLEILESKIQFGELYAVTKFR